MGAIYCDGLSHFHGSAVLERWSVAVGRLKVDREYTQTLTQNTQIEQILANKTYITIIQMATEAPIVMDSYWVHVALKIKDRSN